VCTSCSSSSYWSPAFAQLLDSISNNMGGAAIGCKLSRNMNSQLWDFGILFLCFLLLLLKKFSHAFFLSSLNFPFPMVYLWQKLTQTCALGTGLTLVKLWREVWHLFTFLGWTAANYHVQQLERKDDELGHCFSHNTTHSKHNLQHISKGPWLGKLSLLCAVWSWGHKLLTLLLPHLPVMFLLFPGLVLSRGMSLNCSSSISHLWPPLHLTKHLIQIRL
jgi:hypothetical protein